MEKKIKLDELLDFWKRQYNNLYLDEKVKKQIFYKVGVKRKKSLFSRYFYYVWSLWVLAVFLIFITSFFYFNNFEKNNFKKKSEKTYIHSVNNLNLRENTAEKGGFFDRSSSNVKYNLTVSWSSNETLSENRDFYIVVFVVLLVLVLILGVVIVKFFKKRKK